MEKKPVKYIKQKRKVFGPVINPMGFIFSHHFSELADYNPDTKEWKYNGRYYLDLQLRFFWLGSNVDIHNNQDTTRKSFDAYIKKIKLIDEMATEAYEHISTGNGPLVIREFLNDAEVNDGFGATLFIHIDPDLKSNFCVFEISSCYKKYRYGTDLKGMKEYLKNFLSFMYEVKDNLIIVKDLIDTHCPENKEDGK